MACLQRLLTQQLGVFSLFYRLLDHQKELLAAPCPPADVLFRHYGTLHIHVEWRQYLLWAGHTLYRIGDYKGFAQGLLWSILLFVPYIAFVMYYCRTHAQEISNLLQMTP